MLLEGQTCYRNEQAKETAQQDGFGNAPKEYYGQMAVAILVISRLKDDARRIPLLAKSDGIRTAGLNGTGQEQESKAKS